MAQHKITLLPGDGIGPEVTAAVVSIIECAGVDVEWEKYFVGSEAIARYGDPLPPEVLESILRNRVALKGPVTTPVGTGFTSVNVRLRKTLDLYANLRPVKSMPHIIAKFENVDLIVVRENTEDLYSGLEHEVVPGVVESLKIITERASTRIAKFAFEYARTHNRKRVTAVHKANIMKMSDGLFLQCFRNIAMQYPNIQADDRIVDNLCMQLVIDPNQFDILLLENLYGDIVSDLAGAPRISRPPCARRFGVERGQVTKPDFRTYFLEGIHHFNTRKFWEAHEAWETLWLSAESDLEQFLLGLIQVAAAYHHVQRGTYRGAPRLFAAGLKRLDAFPLIHCGLDRTDVDAAARRHQAWLE